MSIYFSVNFLHFNTIQYFYFLLHSFSEHLVLMHLRGIVDPLVSHYTPPSIHHKSDFSLSVHITHGRGGKMTWRMTKDVTRRKTDTEGDSNGEKRVVTRAETWMKQKCQRHHSGFWEARHPPSTALFKWSVWSCWLQEIIFLHLTAFTFTFKYVLSF